ncbi:hypothetical protein ACKVWC_002782 [Pyricularia oryzae]
MLFVDGVGSGMSLAPQTRLLEDIVCRRHFKMHGSGGGGGPAEEMCKDPAIQKVVAELFGWRAFFDGIPGLLLAMWFGVVADKQGRTRVFFLSLAGQVLSTCWVLFISDMAIFVLSHYRGGSTVSGAVSMIIVTDASPQKYRSNLFFYGQTAHIFAELVGPTMGSALIKNSLWQPLLLGLGLSCYTLGSGFGPFARSLLSSLVEKDMVGTLYTTLSIMDTLGSLLAGPIVCRHLWLEHEAQWRLERHALSRVVCAVWFGVCGPLLLGLSGFVADRPRPSGLRRRDCTVACLGYSS